MSLELKPTVNIVIERNGRVYNFSMPVGAPLGEAYDVSWEVVKAVLGLSKQAVEQEQAKPSQMDQYNHAGE